MSSISKDDVVLWLNGGPGCSSMLGWTQEIGPKILFSGSKNFTSSWNTYSWNNNANLLFF
jgi:carboxypeptidase C (cathepsin A)